MLDRAEEDETWGKIAKTKNFSWLKNYPSDPRLWIITSSNW